jgi:NAD(P)-dependent dehydrogenase (short-subunit alcohol dehydrogenase family)
VGDRFSLAGRVALVTGAGRGIGRAIAVALGAAGAAVACAARSRDQVDSAAAEITAAGGRARALRLDVTRPEQIAAGVEEATAALGPVDVLVNNAGITLDKKTVEVTDEDWDAVLATNLTAMFRCARAVAPGMIRLERGKIINIGSMYGIIGVPRYGLLRQQSRRGRPHAEPGRGVGAARYPGQLSRPGLHEHGHPARGAGGREDTCAIPLEDPGPTHRRAGGGGRPGRLPRLARVGLHDRTDGVP